MIPGNIYWNKDVDDDAFFDVIWPLSLQKALERAEVCFARGELSPMGLYARKIVKLERKIRLPGAGSE